MSSGTFGARPASAARGEAGYAWYTSTRGEPYGVIDGESIARPLRGGRGSVRGDLVRRYAEETGTAPNANALADAMLALEGRTYVGAERELHLRTARQGDTVWLDLGTNTHELVRITPRGWSVDPGSGPTGGGPLFRRTRLSGPLREPAPEGTGDLGTLRAMMRVSNDVWPLIEAWLVSVLILPGQPVPVLALSGEHGTAKSYQTKLLVLLVDPSDSPLRTAPRDVESWAVAAAASRVVALDNVSRIEPWLSDALCRAVTGDGMVRRALYSSEDVSVLSFRRAIAINGIALGGLRGDLADRLIRVDLGQLGEESRRDEADLAAEWEKAHPAALGGLLDLASAVLRALPSVDLDRLPRMADYARVLAAVGQVTGSKGLEAYLGQRESIAAETVESDPVAAAIAALTAARAAEERGPWEGTAADLLGALPAPDGLPRDLWPANAQGMTRRLTRAAPTLRQIGMDVTDVSGPRGTGRRNAPKRWRLAAPRDEMAPGECPACPDVPGPGIAPGQAPGADGDSPGTNPGQGDGALWDVPAFVPSVSAGQSTTETVGTSGTVSRGSLTLAAGEVCPDCGAQEDSVFHAVQCLGEDPAA